MQDLEVPVDCICEETEGFKNEWQSIFRAPFIMGGLIDHTTRADFNMIISATDYVVFTRQIKIINSSWTTLTTLVHKSTFKNEI